jgi:hypothetical protein
MCLAARAQRLVTLQHTAAQTAAQTAAAPLSRALCASWRRTLALLLRRSFGTSCARLRRDT